MPIMYVVFITYEANSQLNEPGINLESFSNSSVDACYFDDHAKHV